MRTEIQMLPFCWCVCFLNYPQKVHFEEECLSVLARVSRHASPRTSLLALYTLRSFGLILHRPSIHNLELPHHVAMVPGVDGKRLTGPRPGYKQCPCTDSLPIDFTQTFRRRFNATINGVRESYTQYYTFNLLRNDKF
jgi:hypothetical protein